MEEPNKIIEPLLKSLNDYVHSYMTLLRLKGTRQLTDITASLLSKTIVILFLLVGLVSLNIALALWLGECLGKTYWGFLSVGGLYAFISLCLLIFQKQMKTNLQNALIQKMQNAQ